MANNKMLSDVRILDFTALLPGPFATVILADLGADVIKVEPPHGDFARQMPVEMFEVVNRNKRSFAINLKQPASHTVIKKLVKWADVAIEGFRPGVADRLGIGPEQLRALKPSLVYCSISGYGQTGPWQDLPGHDFNYLAAAGALSFQGHWNDKRPHRSGLPVADLAGSTYAAIAILAALRHRDKTGNGKTLDISLTEAAMSFMSVRQGLNRTDPGRYHLYPTNDLFDTADGRRISLGIVEEHFWEAFLDCVKDLAPILLDERFTNESSRRKHGDILHGIIQELMKTKTASQWLEILAHRNVPAQLVMNPKEAANSEQAQARKLVQKLNGKHYIPFPVLTEDGPAGNLKHPAPDIGVDTESILIQLGFTEAEITNLFQDGICTK